jgi:hypothetical protein
MDLGGEECEQGQRLDCGDRVSLMVHAEPNPRFMPEFDGEPECNPPR